MKSCLLPPVPPSMRLIKEGIGEVLSKSVYCKDCRYFYYSTWGIRCQAPTGKIIKDYVFGDYPERLDLSIFSKNYPNKGETNGCTYYKRIWWKFWV